MDLEFAPQQKKAGEIASHDTRCLPFCGVHESNSHTIIIDRLFAQSRTRYGQAADRLRPLIFVFE